MLLTLADFTLEDYGEAGLSEAQSSSQVIAKAGKTKVWEVDRGGGTMTV